MCAGRISPRAAAILSLIGGDGKPLVLGRPGQDDQFNLGASITSAQQVWLVGYYQAATPPSARIHVSASIASTLIANAVEPAMGTLAPHSARSYCFEGTPNQMVTLTLTPMVGNAQMDLRLFGPDGVRLLPTTAGTRTLSINTTLPSSGTYVVDVSRWYVVVGDTGAYTLSLSTP
jgi:hypothetical protein